MGRDVPPEHGNGDDENDETDTHDPGPGPQKLKAVSHAGSRSLGTRKKTMRSAIRFKRT
jgi:hypothetical protein